MALKIFVGTTSGDYSVAGNWSPSGVPVATDDVLIQGTVSITAGLNQSAVAIDKFEVDPGYTGTIGSVTAPLQIDPDSFVFAGTGLVYIDLGAAAISPEVRNSASASTSQPYGLYLKGSALATLNVLKGAVVLAGLPDETATVTTVNSLYLTTRASDVSLLLGAGVTVTNVLVVGGVVDMRCAATVLTVSGGTVTTRGAGAIATLTNAGGTVYPASTGTITTAALNSGTTDFSRSRTARTVTTMTSTGDNARIVQGDYLTVTNKLAPSGDVVVTVAQD